MQAAAHLGQPTDLPMSSVRERRAEHSPTGVDRMLIRTEIHRPATGKRVRSFRPKLLLRSIREDAYAFSHRKGLA